MKIDLSQIRIELPDEPTKVWDHSPKSVFYDYRTLGYFQDKEVGYINVSLCQLMLDEEKDSFWFVKKNKIWIPCPVAVYQYTEREYRGQGVSGRLLVLVNQVVKEKYKLSLVSDTDFYWTERGFVKRPSKRVWEKLELEGLAYRRDYKRNPRWVMR